MDNTFEKLIKKEQCLQIIGPCENEGHLFKNELPTVFVDGGIKFKKKYRSKITSSLGDGDSTSKKLKLKLPIKKDQSDLSFALYTYGKFAKTLFLDGFFPIKNAEKRFDHLFANVGEIYQWSKKHNGDAFLCTKMFIIPKGNHELLINGHFGIIAIEKTKISVIGDCEYQLKKVKTILPFSSLTTSNKADGFVKIKCSNPILISIF